MPLSGSASSGYLFVLLCCNFNFFLQNECNTDLVLFVDTTGQKMTCTSAQ